MSGQAGQNHGGKASGRSEAEKAQNDDSKIRLPNRLSWKQSDFGWDDLLALVAGSITVIFFYFVNEALSSAKSQTELRITVAAIFIGLAFGYYLGLASKRGTSVATFFTIGVLSTLSGFVFIQASMDATMYVLVLASADMFLIHASGLIDSHPEIEAWVTNGKNVSWLGLILLAFLQAAPTLWGFLLEVQIRLQQTINFVTNLSDRGWELLVMFMSLSAIGIISILWVLKSFGVFQIRPWKKREK